MNVTFETHLDAIYWIASHVEDENQFEELREELLFNYIFTRLHFLELDSAIIRQLKGPLWTFFDN